MNKTLLRILVRAKEVNKWVATNHLVGVPLHRSILLYLKDQELLLVHRHQHEGMLIKLTLKGYHHYKNVSEE